MSNSRPDCQQIKHWSLAAHAVCHQACVTCRAVHNLTLGASEGLESILLPDIIRQVPTFRDFLPSQSKKAVLSCSRQCHGLMHDFTTAIMVNTLDDLKAISSSAWPSLGLVVIKHFTRDPAAKDAIAQCKLQVMAVFGLRNTEDNYIALILKPSTDQQCQDLAFKRQLESLSRILQSPYTPPGVTSGQVIFPGRTFSSWHLGMFAFDLKQSQLDSASLTQLFSLSWPRLMHLDLSHTTLDAAAVASLAKGSWPQLARVSLSCSILSTTGFAQLAQRLWPRLRYLELASASTAPPDTLLAAVISAWPNIRLLNLDGVQFGAEFAQALAKTHSHIDSLHLRSVSLDRETLSGFKLASWPLTCLHLHNSTIGADAVAALALALCSFPKLHSLYLTHNQLDEAAAQQLTRGRWPQLQHLDVSYNALDNRAMEALAKGQWPKLTMLQLQGNTIDAVGVSLLVKGHWPKLCNLRLDYTAVSAATWALLGLVPEILEEHTVFGVPRSYENSLIWPELSRVTFGAQ